MNIFQINSGKAEIMKDNGSIVRTIGNGDAIVADFSGDHSLDAFTTIRSKVEIHKENGSLIRTIGNDEATNGRWFGYGANNIQ